MEKKKLSYSNSKSKFKKKLTKIYKKSISSYWVKGIKTKKLFFNWGACCPKKKKKLIIFYNNNKNKIVNKNYSTI